MSVEELANIVMNELSFTNTWLLTLTIICIVIAAIAIRKLNEQRLRIELLEKIQDKMLGK